MAVAPCEGGVLKAVYVCRLQVDKCSLAISHRSSSGQILHTRIDNMHELLDRVPGGARAAASTLEGGDFFVKSDV